MCTYALQKERKKERKRMCSWLAFHRGAESKVLYSKASSTVIRGTGLNGVNLVVLYSVVLVSAMPMLPCCLDIRPGTQLIPVDQWAPGSVTCVGRSVFSLLLKCFV